jgi:hypothetical protein
MQPGLPVPKRPILVHSAASAAGSVYSPAPSGTSCGPGEGGGA